MSETVALARGLPSTIREGEILGGKYRLEREIGRGAMGTVWSAVHLSLGQRVAIKLILAEHAQAASARQRFSIEAKAAARLRSRYVVQVYDDGETSAGTPYIVLEYLDGETLEQRLLREGALPLNDAVRITRHVARALSRAHAQGIVHRDLKPANVFLARSEDDELGWVAKVLDFGVAKIVEQGVASTTKTGVLLGTPLFMSPEQVRGSTLLDWRSDLYALGQVFFNMLSGRLPFTGESYADVLVAVCTQPLPDLRAAVPGVLGSVAAWYQRACASDPALRFQSAEEQINALDLALGVSSSALGADAAGSAQGKVDTLPGHASPIEHERPRERGLAEQSGAHARGGTQLLPGANALPGANVFFGGARGSADGPVSTEFVVPTTSSLPLVLGGMFVVALGVLGAWWLARGGHSAASTAGEFTASSDAASSSSAASSSAASSSATASSATASSATASSAAAAIPGPGPSSGANLAAEALGEAPIASAKPEVPLVTPASAAPPLLAPSAESEDRASPRATTREKAAHLPTSVPIPGAKSTRNAKPDMGF